MKTLFLLLLIVISFNTSAQYLSKPDNYIESILTKQKVKYLEGINSEGVYFILAKNISGCSCLFEFNDKLICYREVITALSNPAIVDLIADLDEQHYLQLNDVYFHEESYGLVKVSKKENKFVFVY
jgi:hypothetical protein